MLKPLPSYGDLMTITDFKTDCRNKYLTDWDGTGYYATLSGMSDIPALCVDAWRMTATGEFTHIMWFNK